MGKLQAAQLSLFGLVMVIAAAAAGRAHDQLFAIHMSMFAIAAAILFFRSFRVRELAPLGAGPGFASEERYEITIVRFGVIMVVVWGVVGFLMGVLVASQLAWPWLNPDLPWFTFGRLRPVHTSAVIFAFGGTALITTSLYVVQRTCGAPLISRRLGWFVMLGYQFFILLAATSYVLGGSQSREYAEPEWYIDLWLTIVWVAYLVLFLARS